MFPADCLPAQYTEEREAAEAARRMAYIQEQKAKAQAASVTASLKASQTNNAPPQVSASATAALQRPPLSRPTSSTVLGNIFQTFVRQSPPASTKGSADIEAALLAERRRDADIIGSAPGWY